MILRIRCARLGTVAILAAMCLGCGSQFNFGQVHGTVTLDRAPLEGALVYFYPIIKEGDPSPPPSSSATTDAAGHYELVSRTDQKGAAVGTHRVVVLFPAVGGEAAAKRPKIPQDYQLAARTPLSFEVKPGANDYPIAIKSK